MTTLHFFSSGSLKKGQRERFSSETIPTALLLPPLLLLLLLDARRLLVVYSTLTRRRPCLTISLQQSHRKDAPALFGPRAQRGQTYKAEIAIPTLQRSALHTQAATKRQATEDEGRLKKRRGAQGPGHEPHDTSRASGSAPGSQSWTATTTGVLSSEAAAATTSSASPDKPPAAANSCNFSLKRVWRGPVRARQADEQSKGQSTSLKQHHHHQQQQQQQQQHQPKKYRSTCQAQSTRRHER